VCGCLLYIYCDDGVRSRSFGVCVFAGVIFTAGFPHCSVDGPYVCVWLNFVEKDTQMDLASLVVMC